MQGRGLVQAAAEKVAQLKETAPALAAQVGIRSRGPRTTSGGGGSRDGSGTVLQFCLLRRQGSSFFTPGQRWRLAAVCCLPDACGPPGLLATQYPDACSVPWRLRSCPRRALPLSIQAAGTAGTAAASAVGAAAGVGAGTANKALQVGMGERGFLGSCQVGMGVVGGVCGVGDGRAGGPAGGHGRAGGPSGWEWGDRGSLRVGMGGWGGPEGASSQRQWDGL